MEMAKKVDSEVEKKIKKPLIKRKRRRRHNKSILKKFVDYLKSDSYMFAPLLSRYPSDFHFPAPNAVVSSSASGVEFTDKSLVEQVGNYLNSDSHLYAPLLAPQYSTEDHSTRMDVSSSKKLAVKDVEGTVEKVGNGGEKSRESGQQHKETIVKHMVYRSCRSVSASGNWLDPRLRKFLPR